MKCDMCNEWLEREACKRLGRCQCYRVSYSVAHEIDREATLAAQAPRFKQKLNERNGMDEIAEPGMVTADFPIIAMGLGQVEVGDATHEGIPALWFGKGGRGLDAPVQDLNRPAHDKETLALFTFADVRGLAAIEQALARVRERFFAETKPVASKLGDEVDLP